MDSQSTPSQWVVPHLGENMPLLEVAVLLYKDLLIRITEKE